MDIRLTPIPTPTNIQFNNGPQCKTLESLGNSITSEFKSYKKWTKSCSDLLQQNPKSLFLYDRFEYCLGNAYGADYKIALNPMHILCYHPDCLKRSRCPVKLRAMFVLDAFLEHLQEHVDDIGLAMQTRFGAIVENMFASREELDKMSPSPFLVNRRVELLVGTITLMNAYGIERVLHQFDQTEYFTEYWQDPRMPKPRNPNYVSHWKDILITKGIVKCSSLSFQEDDALIFNVLQFPNPVPDWTVWQTLFLYALKVLCSQSSGALHLHRGVTLNRLGYGQKRSLVSLDDFVAGINHASPSITISEQQLPALTYEKREFHPSEILYHIKSTHKAEKSLIFRFSSMVSRVPCCIQIDEQEINQGAFVKDGELCGLEKNVTVNDIKRIGLQNFAKYITEENNYLIAVREYRVIDFGGIFCSNVFTSFDSHPLRSEECKQDLRKVIEYADSCSNCLHMNKTCEIIKINEPCSNCYIEGTRCESLVVFHVLWDMGSSHKKTKTEHVDGLELTSSLSDMLSPAKYTIGFGGLHLAKALVNSARNHVMQFDGKNFGINFLIALRYSSPLLLSLKNAIFVGKDRQSDLLAWSTVCETVQEALRQLKVYQLQRVPEKYLPYKANAATQKKLIHPVDICCNKNGDIFVLDPASACVHVIDRSIVAIMYTVGIYNTSPYAANVSNKRSNILFSRELRALSVNLLDDLAIVDSGRNEIVLAQKCSLAKTNSSFHILKFTGALSVTWTEYLIVLYKSGAGQELQMLSFDMPRSGSASKKLYLDYRISQKIKCNNIVSIFFVPFERCLGLMNQDKNLEILCYSKSSSNTTVDLNLKSTNKPSFSSNGLLISSWDHKICVHKVDFDGQLAKTLEFSGHKCKGIVSGLCINGTTISATVKDQNSYAVFEFGSLDFAVKYTSAICKLYKAVGYIPPHGKKMSRIECLEECIMYGEECSNFFCEMQGEAEKRQLGRKSFSGREGMPFSATIQCLEATVLSWKVLQKRMEMIEIGSAAKVLPHTLLSESYIEHSFGNVKKSGQGQNQTMDEYVASKRRVAFNFQLKMCQMPFWQHSREKLQTKAYQELESNDCSLTIKDLKEIFAFSRKNNIPKISHELTENDEHLLRKAYLLAKSVPRQSNRSKWREQSGYQPNMLTETVTRWMLCKDDLVCCHSAASHDMTYLIVQQEVELDDSSKTILVSEPGRNSVFSISIEKLITEKGQIFTIPSQLYELDEKNNLQFPDIVEESVAELLSAEKQKIGDDDLALLLEESSDTTPDIRLAVAGTEKEQNATQQMLPAYTDKAGPSCQLERPKKNLSKRKKKIIVSDDDEDDESAQDKVTKKAHVDVGNWVIMKYNGGQLLGIIEKIDEQQGLLLETFVNYSKSNFFTKNTVGNHWYDYSHFVICPPEPANNRGAFKLTETDYSKYINSSLF